MDDIPYSHIRVIYVSCLRALELALCNICNIFILQMALVVLTIITCWNYAGFQWKIELIVWYIAIELF